MTPEQLEQVYAQLATRIDAVGPVHSERFLAKLVLLLAHEHGDTDTVARCIDAAAASLEL
ncbi:MAG: DUF2783 domain-containing protein [Pseudomonadota bacterium]